MASKQQKIIYQGNSVISVETHPEYSHPVVIKKPSKRHPSRRSLRSLEKEYEMTRSLDAVEGVRKAIGKQSIENQPALILKYIDGVTLRDKIAKKALDLRAKLVLAFDLARTLKKIHQQDVFPILFFTLLTYMENLVEDIKSGDLHFLTTPFIRKNYLLT